MGLIYELYVRKVFLFEVLKESWVWDKIMGYLFWGIYKDEFNMLLGDFFIKREGL